MTGRIKNGFNRNGSQAWRARGQGEVHAGRVYKRNSS